MNELTSRALNIDAPIADVSAACLKHDIQVSAIESLAVGWDAGRVDEHGRHERRP